MDAIEYYVHLRTQGKTHEDALAHVAHRHGVSADAMRQQLQFARALAKQTVRLIPEDA